jgi:hypothetical protein
MFSQSAMKQTKDKKLSEKTEHAALNTLQVHRSAKEGAIDRITYRTKTS